MEAYLSNHQLHTLIIDKIDDLKGFNIITLDVKNKSTITDSLIICTANSNRQAMAIAEHLTHALKQHNCGVLAMSYDKEATWIVLDLGDVMVHIMQEETRQYYALEQLWG